MFEYMLVMSKDANVVTDDIGVHCNWWM